MIVMRHEMLCFIQVLGVKMIASLKHWFSNNCPLALLSDCYLWKMFTCTIKGVIALKLWTSQK